jgi:hypothetical protein
MPKSFSEYARDKLLELYNYHPHEVGSVLKAQDPAAYAGYSVTSCITYAINVISHAFEQVGNPAAAKQVRRLGKHGNELSHYLVTSHQWRGIYINPDVVHATDGSTEHSYSNIQVGKTCAYYKIPVTYRVVNYNPTPSTDPNFRKVNKKAPETPLNDVDVKILDKIDFGFGISRGARHTWLFSLGNVYEVHWDEIGSGLYERTAFAAFGWLSGAIVVPPDRTSLLTMSAQKCARATTP